MIPKIIHFCWLSDDAYPKIIKKCIASWKDKLLDYEFMLWDTKRFDINSTTWTKQAFEAKQYAFAADYIRLHATNIYGGIYFDSDVEVLKSFDNLLDLPYFIGSQTDGCIEAAVFGAEKNTDWLQNCLSYYNNRAFINSDGGYDQEILPVIMKSQIEKTRTVIQLKPEQVSDISKWIENDNNFVLFPSEYFSPKDHQTREIFKTKNTYSIHHYNHSWFTFINVLRLEVIKLIGLKRTEKWIAFFNLRKLLSKFKK